jgi:hypothetical protein
MYHLHQRTVLGASDLVATSLSPNQHPIALAAYLNARGIELAPAPEVGKPGWYCCPDVVVPGLWNVSQVFPVPDWEGDPPVPTITKKVLTLEFLAQAAESGWQALDM